MTTETDAGAAILSRERSVALIDELISHTPGHRLRADEISDAVATVADLYTAAATLELWQSGRIRFGWDRDAQELVLCADSYENPADGRLILRGNDDG